MDIVREVKRHHFSLDDSLFDWQIGQSFFRFPGPDAQYCFLFEELETFFEVAGQVAVASSSLRNYFQALTVGSHREGVDGDFVVDCELSYIFVAVFRPVILSVSQCNYSQMAVGVATFELLK